MAIRPVNATLNAASVEILNAIRDNASVDYQAVVPTADGTIESIREIGRIVTSYVALKNEFLSALYNRIGRVIVTSKIFYNPWEMFKKGMLEMGETVEEIFVNIAKPYQFNQEAAETQFMRREIPDVRSAFHTLNYKKFYKATISDRELRQAFTSMSGVTDLIGRIVDQLYHGANYDEFLTMKYMLGRAILNGYLCPSDIELEDGDSNEEVGKKLVTTAKAVSNLLTFDSTEFNIAKVYNHTPKDSQYVIINSIWDALIDVNVLAAAFNMNKAEFMGHRVLIDSFGNLDNARLAELFADDPYNSFTPFTDDEIAALDAIPAVLVDKDFFMIFDNMIEFTEDYNGQGLYWNYWYHTWKTFSFSPFANAVVFTLDAATATEVTVTPAEATVNAGDILGLSATVETTGFGRKTVTWSVTGAASDATTITNNGVLTVGIDETAEELTVTATSDLDDTVSGTCTVTVVPAE